ncbi:ABC-type antimicrobial peptide transport system, ATPase component [Olavius algarvensis associated proteobacterium Delta 3]|nr:ABC-type antimicrobial peptide transport system, ATPase component [Olavius algarvensis associated proteobacterium Delta 3]CAB5137676.1 ABC-type antimicrobial peptide transport system, ATPase component [Olavius algarvensis associated proteobacterium Delta 3]
MDFITADQLTRAYGSGDSTVMAITDVSFMIEAGEFVAVMGESGAGKSTLLSIMGAMNTPTGGVYTVDGIDVYNLGQEQRADFRREFLGFIFQSFHLVPYLNVIENVMLPLTTVRLRRREKETMAMQALSWVGLETKAKRLPNQISGGEKERVAIARAIVNDPPILLADEPTGNLDSRNTQEVMELLQRLNEAGTTVIMVTHSAECAGYARRRLEMSDGRLVNNGAAEPLESPRKKAPAIRAA